MKLKKVLITLALSLSSLLLILGFTQADPTFQETNKPLPILTVQAKQLNSCDSYKIFGRNLLKGGFQPISLTIKNDTPNEYYFSSDLLTLPQVSSEEIVKKCPKENLTDFTLAALFPSFHNPFKNVSFFTSPLLKKAFLLTSGYKPFTLSSTNDQNAEKTFKEKIEKSLEKDKLIVPYSKTQKMLIVPSENFTKTFQFAVVDLVTKEIKTLDVIAE